MSRKNGFKRFNGRGANKRHINYKLIIGDEQEVIIDLISGQLFNNIEQIVAETMLPKSAILKSIKNNTIVGGYKFMKIKGGAK